MNRRSFIQTASSTAGALALPSVLTASRTRSRILLGTDDYRYEMNHDWVQLPDRYTWQTTHNVAVDKNDNLYVIHEGRAEQKDHPAIFVFDSKGKFVRAFGQQFQGGGHGLEIRDENGEEFLYVTAYQQLKTFAKLTLDGKTVWQQYAPMQAGGYFENEDTIRDGKWGRDRFMPTNFAFHPDGGFYVADGYGSWRIHRYDKDAKYVSTFGKPGQADGEFQLPHGLWIDNREKEPAVVVADRVNARLQWFSLDGEHKKTLNGFILPANIDVKDDLMLVPDLSCRVTLLNRENEVVAQLGDDDAWRQKIQKEQLRVKPGTWKQDRFIHPHDACFDSQGNIFVAEWVGGGRITRLTRV